MFRKHPIFKRCAVALLVVLLTSFCTAEAESQPLQIITTVFPAFDLARTLAGDSANVQMLLPPGGESHSYEPTPQDIIAIQNADLFIYVGGESDHWIEEILHSMGELAPKTFSLMDSVTLLEEETSASMETVHSHEHEHEHDHEEHDHGHEESEMDEHVWTSPRNVMVLTQELCRILSELSPAHKQLYASAAERYQQQLADLDAAFAEVVASGKRDILIFGDRFPLRYFAAAYGLRYDAAFPGCSEDSEPSVRTVISLVDTVREQQIPVICYIEFSSRRTADILAEETGATPLLFHSCHNVSAEEIESGATYLSLMWHNVEVLKEALN